VLAQIIYMGWISRARTLPLFMEATHAVTSFAVTATLLSAIVRPFGRPFKVTDKGGDRSAPRVHWKLAAIFGIIAASSAGSIVWAFVSPNVAGEISSIDFFNLVWAAIAMLIAFVAFLVCFELPRGEQAFAIDEAARLAVDREVHDCRVASLSTASVRLDMPPGKLACQLDSPIQLHLDWLGWVKASVISRSGNFMHAQLHPDFEQRQRLVVRLFGSSCGTIAGTAHLRGALAGLARRGFLGR
jgi:cellulose synthase (UDP-forming)